MTDDGAPPDRRQLERRQRDGLRELLSVLLRSSPFYRAKLEAGIEDPEGFELGDLARLPFTTKEELVADQEANPPYGSLLTRPLEDYVRIHRTSGTSGHPLRWLDTAPSWSAFLDCWVDVFEAAGVSPRDRVLVAFSFGPFIGFWGAFEGAQRLGALTISGGAQTTRQRLQTILDEQVTVVVSTPTYALHLAEVAAEEGIDLAGGSVTRLIQAGEPGASVAATRERMETQWDATVYDHAGATELGAWGHPADPSPGSTDMAINEDHFLCELVDPESGRLLELTTDHPVRGELVLTSFRRLGSPLLRYRTGDLVEMLPPDSSCPRHRLVKGVLGRVDDMFLVRGVNVFPSAIENVVFGLGGVTEFRGLVHRVGGMVELDLEIEPDESVPSTRALTEALEERLRDRLSLRVPVRIAAEPLPRWELKARRFQFSEGSPG